MTSFSDKTRRLTSSSPSIVDQIIFNYDLSSKTADEVSWDLAQALFNINGQFSEQVSGFKQLAAAIAAAGIVSEKIEIGQKIRSAKFDPVLIELRIIAEKIRPQAESIIDAFYSRYRYNQESRQCINGLLFYMNEVHKIFNKVSTFFNKDITLSQDDNKLLEFSLKLILGSFGLTNNKDASLGITNKNDYGCPILKYLYEGGDQPDYPTIRGSTRQTGIFANVMMLSLVEINILTQFQQDDSLATDFPQSFRDAYYKISDAFRVIQSDFDQNMIRNLLWIFDKNSRLPNLDLAFKIRDIIKVAFPEYCHFIQVWDDSETGNSQAIHTYLGLEKMRVNYFRTRDYQFSQKKFIVLVSAERDWAYSDKSGHDRARKVFLKYYISFNKPGKEAFLGEGDTPNDFVLWNNQQHLKDFNASPNWIVGYCIVKNILNYQYADTNPKDDQAYMNSLQGHATHHEGQDYILAYWG